MSTSLADLPATFTTQAARRAGVHPRDLYRWRDEEEIIQLSRGVFRRADSPAASLPDLLALAYRVPAGVVCCISALAVHDLTDELPRAVQIAVPRQQRPPHIDLPPTEVFRFDAATFTVGLSSVEAAPGEHVRIYTAERSVVDVLRLRQRLGEPLAYTALRRYLGRRGAQPSVLLALARQLDVLGPLRTALDVVTAA